MRLLIFFVALTCMIMVMTMNIANIISSHHSVECNNECPDVQCNCPTCFACESPSPCPTASKPALPLFEELDISTSSQGNVFKAKPIRQSSLDWRKRDYVDLSSLNKSDSSTATCDKWIVITTIFPPTALVRQIESPAGRGWCLVVVGDKKSPPGYSVGPRVRFLSPNDQEELDFKITQHLPWNHFGRKNIGYMYAITKGAKVIYDTDDDNLLKLPMEDILGLTEGVHPLVDTEGEPVTNLYRLFSSKFSWPRGFPLDRVQPDGPAPDVSNSSAVPSVFQALADHDPDVDAIYRLTRPLPLNFDRTEHSTVALPKGTFSPFNAQATMFKEDALWALLLPVTVHGRVSDIWRSYLVQRIMWDAGLTVAFTKATVKQCRNVHTYLADFDAEDHLYGRTGEMIRILMEWEPKSRTMSGRLIEGTALLYEHAFLEFQDVELMDAWVDDLMMLGYQFPTVRSPRYHAPGGPIVHQMDPLCEKQGVYNVNTTVNS